MKDHGGRRGRNFLPKSKDGRRASFEKRTRKRKVKELPAVERADPLFRPSLGPSMQNERTNERTNASKDQTNHVSCFFDFAKEVSSARQIESKISTTKEQQADRCCATAAFTVAKRNGAEDGFFRTWFFPHADTQRCLYCACQCHHTDRTEQLMTFALK